MNETPNLFADGKSYERLMGRWSRLAGEKFLNWLNASKNLKWLDVGCGNGAFTQLLIERCAPASIIGIDPSQGQIDYARTRPRTKDAEFRVADAQACHSLTIVSMPHPWHWSSCSFPTRSKPRARWRAWCVLAVSPPLTCGNFLTVLRSRPWARQ